MRRALILVTALGLVLSGVGFGVGSIWGARDAEDLIRQSAEARRIASEARPPELKVSPASIRGRDANEPLPLDEELLAALQSGGYVIYLRHTTTDRAQKDVDPIDLKNCATQRNLNDQGVTEARELGEIIRRQAIPVGEVYASPFCRTKQTAELAFGARIMTLAGLEALDTYTGPIVDQRNQALRTLLAMAPVAGSNSVIVGHWQNLLAATGIRQDFEGEGAIFLPTGTKFSLVARVAADGWRLDH